VCDDLREIIEAIRDSAVCDAAAADPAADAAAPRPAEIDLFAMMSGSPQYH
jgi:hypothetical protein